MCLPSWTSTLPEAGALRKELYINIIDGIPVHYPCNRLLKAALLMSVANFKELLPILPKAAISAANVA